VEMHNLQNLDIKMERAGASSMSWFSCGEMGLSFSRGG